MKKDFTAESTQRVYQTIEEATAEPEAKRKKYKDRREYTEEEAEAFLDTFQSAGRKGLKLPRINMAFSPENYEYIRRMARARGETLTTCLNWMIKEHRDQNQDTYQKILEFLETL